MTKCRNIDSFLPEYARKHIWKRDEYRCRSCGGEARLSVHHCKPRAQGGRNDAENLVLLCDPCHDAIEGLRLDSKEAEGWWYRNRAFPPLQPIGEIGKASKEPLTTDYLMGRFMETLRLAEPVINRFAAYLSGTAVIWLRHALFDAMRLAGKSEAWPKAVKDLEGQLVKVYAMDTLSSEVEWWHFVLASALRG